VAQGNDKLEGVSKLIGQVYDAALDETLWAGLAPEIAATFDSTSTAVFSFRDRGAEYISNTKNHIALRHEYEEHFNKIDPFTDAGVRFPNRVFTNREVLTEEAYRRTELYQDFCRKIEVFHVLGAVAQVGDGEFDAIGIHRPHDHRAYDETDKQAADRFWPHLRRALQLRRCLAAPGLVAGVAFDALERSGTAALVATDEGRILYANRAAERLLRAGEGIAATGGRLASTRRPLNDRLLALVRAAADTASGSGASPGGAVAIERDERLPLTVLVAPFRPAKDGFGAPLPAAIVFIRDPEQPTVATMALQGLFGLSPAEACIAGQIADGKSTDDIARRHRIAPNTVRMHLKSVFAKTGATGQAQLVSLILRSVAAL